MSKKNKVSSAKAKSSAKSKSLPKAKGKPQPAKKTVAKKPVKKLAAKPVVKKAVKPVKKAAKPVKKVNVKTSAKPVKKIAPKKIVAKKKAVAPKKAVKQVIKKKEVKKVSPKPSVKAKPPVKSKTSAATAKPAKVSKTNTVAQKPVKQVKPLVQTSTVVKAKPEKTEKISESKVKTTSKPVSENSEPKKEEVLAIMNTIPKEEINELSASKIASITSSITNPVKRDGAYAVKAEKEPNGKFEIEFPFRASPEMLYEFFSTPSGLSEWFCDDVNIRNGIYTFIWDGQMQQARLLKTVENQLARYQWVDKTDGSYFEFRIQRDDLTNDISLIVTDFADTKSEQESSKLLWNSQVEKLMHVIGSIY